MNEMVNEEKLSDVVEYLLSTLSTSSCELQLISEGT